MRVTFERPLFQLHGLFTHTLAEGVNWTLTHVHPAPTGIDFVVETEQTRWELFCVHGPGDKGRLWARLDDTFELVPFVVPVGVPWTMIATPQLTLAGIDDYAQRSFGSRHDGFVVYGIQECDL